MNDASKISLRRQFANSSFWVILTRVVKQGGDFVKAIVLARLLTPADFGLFAIVMLAIIAAESFSQTGFNTALIQKKEEAHNYLNSAWTVEILRGFVLFALLYVLAPFVSDFFNEFRAADLIRVVSFSVLLKSFNNVGLVLLHKQMIFKKLFIYETLVASLSMVVGICLAYALRSVWALVWTNVFSSVVALLFSFLIHTYRPRIRFDWGQIKELFGFGKWMLGYAAVIFAWQQIDTVMIGKLLGPAALGLYQMAYRLANLPATQLGQAIGSVAFPAYAKIQNDKKNLGRLFLEIQESMLLIVLPLCAFFCFAADELILGLLGEQWVGATVPLQLLSVASMLAIFEQIANPLFIGCGQPKLAFLKDLAKAIVLVVLVYPLTKLWGPVGTCLSLGAANVAAVAFCTRVGAFAEVSLKGFLSSVWPAFLLALLIGPAVWLSNLLTVDNKSLALALSLATSVLFYLLGNAVLFLSAGRGVFPTIMKFRTY